MPKRYNPQFAFDVPLEQAPALMVRLLKQRYGTVRAAARALDAMPRNGLGRRGRDESPTERDERLRAGPALKMIEDDPASESNDAAVALKAIQILLGKLAPEDLDEVRKALAEAENGAYEQTLADRYGGASDARKWARDAAQHPYSRPLSPAAVRAALDPEQFYGRPAEPAASSGSAAQHFFNRGRAA